MFTNYSTNETKFTLNALKEGMRIDGRALDQYRELTIRMGNSNGQNITDLGATSVYTDIQVSTSTPDQDRPKEGFIRINVGTPITRPKLP